MSYADLRLVEARMALRDEQASDMARNRLLLRQAGLEREGWMSRQRRWLVAQAASAADALQSGFAGLRQPQEQCCTG